MAIKRCQSSVTVVQAAEQRIINVFRNGLPVYMSFSGGKDSLVLSNIVLSLIQRGKIDPSQLTSMAMTANMAAWAESAVMAVWAIALPLREINPEMLFFGVIIDVWVVDYY